jgi:hypothetical protein
LTFRAGADALSDALWAVGGDTAGDQRVCCAVLCWLQAVAYIPPHQAHLTHAVARWSAASMWVGKALVRQAAPLREELRGECASQLWCDLLQLQAVVL